MTDGSYTVPGLSLQDGHKVAHALQDRLNALNDLQLTLKHVHWNVVGRDFIVTVRHGEGINLSDSRHDLEERAQVLEHGPMGVMYAICDRVVDEYEKVGAALEEDVDEVEESVFSPGRTDDSVRIYVLKREIAEVRRAVGISRR